MTRLSRCLLLAALAAAPRAHAAQHTAAPEVLLRLDDVGMNHSVNLAIAKVAAAGLPFSVSVLFACPWYQEAVEILKRHPDVAVGVHLALNSEWRNYRWGPVLGQGGVPSLVDSVGYFHSSSRGFLQSRYDLGEVERELSAQVERALASGLRVTYVDAHMGTAEATPQLREVTERVARKYGLGISTRYGESYYTLWGVPVAQKKSALLSRLAGAARDSVHLIEVHVAERTPEMEVIFDMNAPQQNAPGAGVVDHRKAELETMLSPELAELARTGRVRLVTYRDLAARAGGAAAAQGGWVQLFDGKSLTGWRASENPATFSVRNGEIVVHGDRAHLFYDGPVMSHRFTDFELEVEVLTKPKANSGIFIRTEFQPEGWPSKGYEVQVNNSHTDWRRTGSLYAVQDVREGVGDDRWFKIRTMVQGRRVRIFVDGKQVVDYTEPAGSPTRLTGGTIALQGHDPGSEVHYRSVRIRPLPPAR